MGSPAPKRHSWQARNALRTSRGRLSRISVQVGLLLKLGLSAAGTASASVPPPSSAEPGETVTRSVDESPFRRWVGEDDYIYAQTSLTTRHFNPKPYHNNDQRLVDLSWHWQSGALAGFSYFRNSFEQPSQFVYGGYKWWLDRERGHIYLSVIAGALHGYDGERQDEIPFNRLGIAPAVLPVIGLRYRSLHTQLILFGRAGATLTLGLAFDAPRISWIQDADGGR